MRKTLHDHLVDELQRVAIPHKEGRSYGDFQGARLFDTKPSTGKDEDRCFALVYNWGDKTARALWLYDSLEANLNIETRLMYTSDLVDRAKLIDSLTRDSWFQELAPDQPVRAAVMAMVLVFSTGSLITNWTDGSDG